MYPLTGFLIRLLLLMPFWLAASSALAAPHIADFSLGITGEETRMRSASPCGDNLCGEVGFGGKNWGGTFVMKDDRLTAITLFGPLEDAYVEAAFAGFKDSPYVVYRAATEERCFDFIEEGQKGLSSAELDADFATFLSEVRKTGHTFASYFYTEPAVYEALKKAARPDTLGGAAPCPPRQELPVAMADRVACCLTVDDQGVTIIIMPWAEMRHSLAKRTLRDQTGEAAAPTGEQGGQHIEPKSPSAAGKKAR